MRKWRSDPDSDFKLLDYHINTSWPLVRFWIWCEILSYEMNDCQLANPSLYDSGMDLSVGTVWVSLREQSLVRFWNLGEEYLLFQTANWPCTVKILESTNHGTWQQSHTQKHTLAWSSASTDMWMVTSQTKNSVMCWKSAYQKRI